MTGLGAFADMDRQDRRTLMLGLMFASTAALATAATPRAHEDVLGRSRLEQVIPDQIGDWRHARVGSLVLPETETRGSIYDQVLARTYVADAKPLVMLLIAYGAAQSGLMQVHRPETCYGSSGYRVAADHAVSIEMGPGQTVLAKTFSASREGRNERVLYWTRISRDFPRDPIAQRLVMLRRGLSGVLPDGVLVRISTLDTDPAASADTMTAFARALVRQARPIERALLLGAVSGTDPGRMAAT